MSPARIRREAEALGAVMAGSISLTAHGLKVVAGRLSSEGWMRRAGSIEARPVRESGRPRGGAHPRLVTQATAHHKEQIGCLVIKLWLGKWSHREGSAQSAKSACGAYGVLRSRPA